MAEATQFLKVYCFLLIFKEKREKHLLVLPAGDGSHNTGMYPDQKSNQQSFGTWDDTQPNEPHS